jgi:hypothetical protein
VYGGGETGAEYREKNRGNVYCLQSGKENRDTSVHIFYLHRLRERYDWNGNEPSSVQVFCGTIEESQYTANIFIDEAGIKSPVFLLFSYSA